MLWKRGCVLGLQVCGFDLWPWGLWLVNITGGNPTYWLIIASSVPLYKKHTIGTVYLFVLHKLSACVSWCILIILIVFISLISMQVQIRHMYIRQWAGALSSLICPESYRIQWNNLRPIITLLLVWGNNAADRAITPFKVILGHQVWY